MATVTFFSNYLEHVLVRRPQIDVPIATGGWQTTQPPVRYKFQPALNEKGEMVGRLDLKTGQDSFKDHSGWLADGQDQTLDRDAVEAIKAHREFGRDFWEHGHEPGTLYPRPVDWRRDVTRASVALDENQLLEMVEKERRSHGRADLIREAETALESVREMLAAQAEHAEKQAAALAAGDAEAERVAAKGAPKAKAKPKAAATA